MEVDEKQMEKLYHLLYDATFTPVRAEPGDTPTKLMDRAHKQREYYAKEAFGQFNKLTSNHFRMEP